MANTYYALSTSTTMADIKAALTDKYGAGIMYHYDASGYLIFSCASITNKVIKLYWASARLRAYYGDAYSSGSTITSEVQFAGGNTGTTSELHLVLGDNLLFITLLSSTLNSVNIVIGKLDNNDYAVFGTMGYVNATYTANSIGKNTTDNVDLKPIAWEAKFGIGGGKLTKQKLILLRGDGAIEENTDGSVASFQGLFNASHTTSVTSLIKGANYLLSPTNQYMSDFVERMRTCILAEW